MDKNKTRLILEEAVRKTNLRFPTFQGVIIFGSFITSENPRDLDILPVMERYKGEWNLQSVDSEGEPCDDEPDYQMWLELEDYFLSHFPLLPEDSKIKGNYMKGKERGVHYEHLISLSAPLAVGEVLANYNARPENFVGNQAARCRLMEICEEEKGL